MSIKISRRHRTWKRTTNALQKMTNIVLFACISSVLA